MPKGLSAEHLGLADYYFWDNFWSLAGIEAYREMSRLLDRNDDARYADSLFAEYLFHVEQAIDAVQRNNSTRAIPATPTRGADCGMIGSVCGWYPLQIFAASDDRLHETLNLLMEQFSRDGMFFQQFIHSGMNAYLTLHIAHAWLYAGNREKFWEIFQSVVRHATPTLNFPEAIHPHTGGGSMGDGHHGWAAAEIVLALRDAFVYESRAFDGHYGDLKLLSGIPRAWFQSGKTFSLSNAPTFVGRLSIRVATEVAAVKIEVQIERSALVSAGRLHLLLPVEISGATVDETRSVPFAVTQGQSAVELEVRSARIELRI
jgi:hypothetical protein